MATQNQRVYLEGCLNIPTDKIEAVKLALPEHVRLTKLEPGCLSFRLKFSDTDKGKLLVSEVFLNKYAFEAHQKRMRTSEWFKITEGFSREYTICEDAPNGQ